MRGAAVHLLRPQLRRLRLRGALRTHLHDLGTSISADIQWFLHGPRRRSWLVAVWSKLGAGLHCQPRQLVTVRGDLQRAFWSFKIMLCATSSSAFTNSATCVGASSSSTRSHTNLGCSACTYDPNWPSCKRCCSTSTGTK